MLPGVKPCSSLLFVLLLGAFPGAASAAPSLARTTGGEGCIKEQAEGACKEAAVGASLSTGMFFVAGKGGATLEFSDKAVVRLVEGAEIRMMPRTKIQLSAKEETPASVVQLNRGKIFVDLPAAKVAFLAKAQHQTTAIVKRGSGVVKVSEDAVVMASFSGMGVLASGNDYNDVPAGKMRIMRKGDPKGTVRDLPATPAVQASKVMAVRIEGAKAEPLRLLWKALSVDGYEVEVRPVGGASSLRRVAKDQTGVSLDDLAPGAYEVGVRAVDAEGFESPWSAPLRLNVVSIELPTGGVILSNGTIQLPDKQKLKLRHTSGLEATFNDIEAFSAPPSEIGLLGGRAQTLRLRRKGETEEFRVRLEPRDVKALVEMSPKNPKWPDNPIAIEIRAVSGDGGPAPSNIEVVPRVTIDVEPVSLSWSRDGDRLKAVLAPRDDGKLHVVRVEVADQHGLFLGRNFIEVTPSRPR